MKNILVENLSTSLTRDELRALFQGYGAVEEIDMVTDLSTGYSQGSAFVAMTNDLEAAKAVADLDGTTVGGNPLHVEEARPRLQRRKSTH